MAKLFISYSISDTPFVEQLAEKLQNYGHEVYNYSEALVAGEELNKTLSNALKNADGVIAIITDNSIKSQYVLSEIGAARAYINISQKKFLFPIVFGDVEIPAFIKDIFYLRAEANNIAEIAYKINHAISQYIGKRAAEEEIKEKQIEKIESNASVYVDKALSELKKREGKNKLIGNIWYILGFTSLLSGVLFALQGILSIKDIFLVNPNLLWQLVILLTLKSVIVIGLLVAGSKYSFTLGKSFMSEALKNADRTHAISFGEFYLSVYGTNASWQDLKEVFQHWNIDRDTTFSKLDTSQFDPKFVELAVELSKIISMREKK